MILKEKQTLSLQSGKQSCPLAEDCVSAHIKAMDDTLPPIPRGWDWHAGEGGPTLFAATGAERASRQMDVSETGRPAP